MMAVANTTLRTRMLLTTAVAALTIALPSAAHAQLVRSTDLSSAVDSGGNPNRLTVTDTNATTTDIEVEAAVVVAEWTDFNVDFGDTVNVTIDAGLGITEATLFNRVIGGNPSNINGTINAPDINFWLINQNGILFGNDTAITAQSFFASTIDVANQDIFDFYEGTNVFANGTDTLNFAGPSTSAVQATGNATFITDGSLMFAGQQLDLTGSFDAGTGRAIFVSAADVDVTFTPGSPLSYTVNGGTTVASGLTVDGTVAGAAAEFAMITDVGVVGALLQVDANVTATTAVATDRGVTLLAQSLGAAKPDALVNGAVSSNGEVLMNSEGDLTLFGSVDGADVSLTAGGDLGAGPISATGGDATLVAGGNVAAGNVLATQVGMTGGAIDIDSTGGGTVTLGQLGADGDIAIDTTGSLTVNGAINAGGAFDVGAVAQPSGIVLNGNTIVGSIDITTTGTFDGLDLTATAGNLAIDASDVTAAALSATDNVFVNASNTVSLDSVTADSDANDVGDALLGQGTTPFSMTITGAVTGAEAFARATVLNVGDVSSTNGNATVTGFNTTAGAVSATRGDVTVQGVASVTVGPVTATTVGGMGGNVVVSSSGGATVDVDSIAADANVDLDTTGALLSGAINAGGALTVGAVSTPSSVSFTGNVTVESIAIDSLGLIDALDLTSSEGDVDLTAVNDITAGDVIATRGDVTIQTGGAVTTTSISADRVMGTGGQIDIDSFGGGDLNLGDLTADSNVTLDTLGVLTVGAINAPGGLIDIGSTNAPSMVNITGPQTAGAFIINAVTDFMSGDLTATNGEITINAPSIDSGNLSATGGDVTLTAPNSITTLSITSIESGGMGGAIDVDSTAGGAVDLGDLTADGAVTLDTLGTLAIGTVNAGGALIIGGVNMPATTTFGGDITAGSFAFTTTDPFTVDNVTTTDGSLSITAPSITSDTLSATGGDVTLAAVNAITTLSITSSESGGMGGAIDVDSTAGGAVDLGDLTADGLITLDTTGTLAIGTVNAGGALDIGSTNAPSLATFGGDITAASFLFTTVNPFSAFNITATDGDLLIDAPSIDTQALSATGGDVTLTSAGAVTTGTITAIENGGVGGGIAVQSNGAGDLLLGDLTASEGITLDTTGLVSVGVAVADDDGDLVGDLVIGGVLISTGVTLSGPASGANVGVLTNGVLDAADVTATNGTAILLANGINAGTVLASDNVLMSGGTGAVDVGDVTASDGVATLTGASIVAGNVSATGGDVTLSAAGDITALNVTSVRVAAVGGAIDIDSTGGGAVALGDLTADEGISLDTTGALSAGAVDADDDGDLTGALLVGATGAPASVAFSGNASAGIIDIDASGLVSAMDITATAGNLDINAGSIAADALSATGGDLILQAASTITTASLSSTGGVDVDSTGGNIALGTVSAAGGDVDVMGTGNIATASIDALAGAVNVNSTNGGNLDLGALNAATGITLDTSGSLTTGAINADSDGNLSGALSIGSMDQPGAVRFTGDVSAESITILASGAVTALDTTNLIERDLTSTAGGIDITADSLRAGAVSADGGDIAVTTPGDVSTSSIATTTGLIDIDSLNGDLTLGTLTANTAITLDTAGNVRSGAIAASGSLTVGGATPPASVRFTEDVSAASVTITSTGTVVALDDTDTIARDIASTAGGFAIDAGSLSAGAISATGGDASLSAAGAISTASVSSTGLIDVDSNGGDLTLGALTAGTTIALDTPGSVRTDAILAGGALSIGSAGQPSAVRFTGHVDATAISIQSSGAVTALDATDTNETNLTASAGAIGIDAASLRSAALTANGGNAVVNVSGDVATASITSTAAIDVDSTGGGALTVGDLVSGADMSLDTTGAVQTGTVMSGGAFEVGGVADVASADFQGMVEGASVSVSAVGAVTGTIITATGGNLAVDAGSITGTDLEASENVSLDASGTINVQSAIADSDMDGTGALEIGVGTTASQVAIAGSASGTSVTILSDGGPITVGSNPGVDTLTATNGGITLDAINSGGAGNGINVQAQVSATGGDVSFQSDGGIEIGGDVTAIAVAGMGGAIDIQSTGGGQVTLEGLTSDSGILLDTAGQITANGAILTDADNDGAGDLVIGSRIPSAGDVVLDNAFAAPGISITVLGGLTARDLTATNGDIDIDASQISADTVTASETISLDAAGAISVANAIADSDLNGTGDLIIGSNEAPASIAVGTGDPATIDFSGNPSLGSFVGGTASGANVTLVSNGLVAVGEVAASAGDAVITSGDNVRVDNVNATDLSVEAAGNLRVDGDINAGGEGTLQANDMFLEGTVNVAGAGLTLRANPGRDVLIGDAMGDPEAVGDFHISDAELDRIDTGNLTIDAGDGNIDIGTVTFTDQAGANSVVIVNRGPGTVIEIEGNITGTGMGRVFQIGENQAGSTDVTSQIIGKIEKSSIDLGTATLDLQATNIVFGSTQLQAEIAGPTGVTADAVAFNFVGNSGSVLFNPDATLLAARAGNDVYLRAGNLVVTYGEIAVFQNTLPLADGDIDFAGVVIGDAVNQNGSLTLRPTDATNAFGLFGELNELNGDAVAFAPDPILVIDGQASVFGSRINGCLIRSGADCITTVVDTTIIQVPREAVSLLTADPDVFLPFDPLVGTNNEGLFSGAAAGPGDTECDPEEDSACR